MSQRPQNNIAAVLLALLFGGCNVVKYLQPGEQLYTGARVNVQADSKTDQRLIKKHLTEALKPKPNQTIGGVRFKLWFYYVAGPDPKKGLKRMLKYKLGEKPVLFDPAMPVHVADILRSRLSNMGFFDSEIRYEVHNSGRKTSVTYSAVATSPYEVESLTYPADSSVMAAAIRSLEKETLVKPGKRYDLNLLKNERARIDQGLKEEGYYFFSPDHLLFRADSTVGNRKVRLRLEIKNDIPEKATVPYRIGEVYIHSSRRMRDSTRRKRREIDTLLVDGFRYIARDSAFRPSSVTRAIMLRPGEWYSRKKHSSSLSRLMSMGVFHSVNMRFRDTLTAGTTGTLNTHVYLNPMRKRTLQVELQAVTKSNNYSGPALNVNYKNRNLFRGAELLVLNMNTNYEMQFTGVQKGFNSYEVGGTAQLLFPRFLVPFRLTNVSSTYIPRTKIEVGFRNIRRMLYFTMNGVNFSYGYQWRESFEKEHQLNPFTVNFAKVMKSTPEFEDLLAGNPFLRRTFEQQFTIGGDYSFTYNGLVNSPRRDQYYFNGMLDVSGNLLYLIHRSLYNRRPTVADPFYLFNFRYAQYSKISTDGRYYHTFNKNSWIATRLLAGVGVPYGNSRSLPYIKQFFSGGANSIRGFLPRTVGPGVYASGDSAQRRSFLDQSGDIRFEANAEYRFTMISFLKGAVFLDAGNVWLFRENELLPGGKFDLRNFHRQLAVGSGFGFRIDITYFVLRFDLGIPLRKPFVKENKGWVIRDIDFGSRSWRRQNLVLNIAIGYPF